MRQRRQLLPHGLYASRVELGQHDAHAFVAHRQHLAPGVDDHAVAVGAAAVLVHAALRRRDHVALVLDRPRAQQQLPMRESGGVGERRRHAQQVARRMRQARDTARETAGRSTPTVRRESRALRTPPAHRRPRARGLRRSARARCRRRTDASCRSARRAGRRARRRSSCCAPDADRQCASATCRPPPTPWRGAPRRPAIAGSARRRRPRPPPACRCRACRAGRSTRAAPPTARLRARPRRSAPAAVSRLRATSGVETICRAAIFMVGKRSWRTLIVSGWPARPLRRRVPCVRRARPWGRPSPR